MVLPTIRKYFLCRPPAPLPMLSMVLLVLLSWLSWLSAL
jgi:hypothetical protein